MQQYEQIDEFLTEGIAYIGRNSLFPSELTDQLGAILANVNKMTVLDEIYGLRAGSLRSKDDNPEHVLAILQEFPGKRYVVFISIIRGSIADVRTRCSDPSWKQKILIAAGQLIALARFGRGDWDARRSKQW